MKTIKEEIKAIEDYYNISLCEGKKRESVYFKYAVINRYRKLGVTEIGRQVGCNHSTIVANLKKFDALMKNKDEYMLSIYDLSLNFNARKLNQIREDILVKKNKYVKKDLDHYKETKRIKQVRAEVTMNEVITTLRHYPKNHLWNKEIDKWEQKDVNEFQRLASRI